MYKQIKEKNKPLWYCIKNSGNNKKILIREYKKTIAQFDAYWYNVLDKSIKNNPMALQYNEIAMGHNAQGELIEKKYREDTGPLYEQIDALKAQIRERTAIKVAEISELQKENEILYKKRTELVDMLMLDLGADKREDYYDFICAIILKNNLPCKKHISAEDQVRIMNNCHKVV